MIHVPNMYLTPQQLQELKDEIPITKLLGKPLRTTRVDCVLLGHENDNSKDMYIDPSGSKFYCHKCKLGGDVIKFVQLVHSLSFTEALEYLITNYSDRKYDLDDKIIDERDVLMRQVLEIYRDELIKSNEAKQYVVKRGWDLERFIGFGGYDSGNLLTQYFKVDTLIKHGLVKPKPKLANTLENRLIFPTYNIKGKLVQFMGRRLSDDESQAKIIPLGSSNQKIFKFNNYLFNENILHEPLKYIFVCEGQPDTYTLMEMGINAVGLSGNNNLYKHAYKLAQVKNIALILDNDEATQNKLVGEIINLLDKLVSLESESKVFVVEIPNNLGCKDINELKVKYNIDKKFISQLKRQDAREFLINKLGTDIRSHHKFLHLMNNDNLFLLSQLSGLSIEALKYGRVLIDPIR